MLSLILSINVNLLHIRIAAIISITCINLLNLFVRGEKETKSTKEMHRTKSRHFTWGVQIWNVLGSMQMREK